MSDKIPDAHPMNVIPTLEEKPKIGLKITELLLAFTKEGGAAEFGYAGPNCLEINYFHPIMRGAGRVEKLGTPGQDLKKLEKALIESLDTALKEIKGE